MATGRGGGRVCRVLVPWRLHTITHALDVGAFRATEDTCRTVARRVAGEAAAAASKVLGGAGGHRGDGRACHPPAVVRPPTEHGHGRPGGVRAREAALDACRRIVDDQNAVRKLAIEEGLGWPDADQDEDAIGWWAVGTIHRRNRTVPRRSSSLETVALPIRDPSPTSAISSPNR